MKTINVLVSILAGLVVFAYFSAISYAFSYITHSFVIFGFAPMSIFEWGQCARHNFFFCIVIGAAAAVHSTIVSIKKDLEGSR